MNVDIRWIRHGEQRYETSGDWWFDHEAGVLRIRVSNMNDWRYEMAVATHELVEALLCIHDGVQPGEVDDFDKEFEDARRNVSSMCDEGSMEFRGKEIPWDSEPGDHPDAPYHRQHCFATAVERLLIAALGCSWSAYTDANDRLYGTGGHA